MARSVPPVGRILDLAGLLTFLAGASLYAWAWLQLRHLESAQPVARGFGFLALARYANLSRLSRIGLVVMAIGAGLAVVAAVVARIVSGRESTSQQT